MKANNTLDIATTSLATLVEEHPSIAEDLLKHSFLPAFLLYPILYSALRFRKRNVTHKKFLYPDRKLLSSMTNTDAQQITKDIAQWEFLKIYTTYLQFGLFKTYGILPISKLSVATKGLSTAESASKRYEDTTVLIRDYLFNIHDPHSKQTIQALSHMNYLHSPYIKARQIPNADLLYPLSVFTCEPAAWIERYEWRSLIDMETAAIRDILEGHWRCDGDHIHTRDTSHETAGKMASSSSRTSR